MHYIGFLCPAFSEAGHTKLPLFKSILPCQVGLVVSVSASHMVGRGFAPQSGHTKDYHENATNCLPAWHAGVRVGV